MEKALLQVAVPKNVQPNSQSVSVGLLILMAQISRFEGRSQQPYLPFVLTRLIDRPRS
jgi:hypothetical protein